MTVGATLAANRRDMRPCTEEAVVALLVTLVLEDFGYTAATLRREYGIGRKRVDLALWPASDTVTRHPPAVIVEAKKPFASYGNSSDARAPACGGLKRRSQRRRDGSRRRFSICLPQTKVDPVALFGALALHGDVATALNTGTDPQARLAKVQGDWHRVAWTLGPKTGQEDVLSEVRVAVGYAEVASPLRDDVHVLMKALAATMPARAAACLVAHRNSKGKTVRVATHRGGRTGVGQTFDAEVPNDKAAEAVNRLLGVTKRTEISEHRIEEIVSGVATAASSRAGWAAGRRRSGIGTCARDPASRGRSALSHRSSPPSSAVNGRGSPRARPRRLCAVVLRGSPKSWRGPAKIGLPGRHGATALT